MEPLSFRDRIVYGVIAMVFGFLLGFAAAFILVFEFELHFLWGVVVFSTLYFFGIGFIQGPEAGSFAGQAVAAASAVASDYPSETSGPRQPHAWGSAWLFAVYVGTIALMAWRA